MTEIPPSMEKATPLAVFLTSVCPGLPILDDNLHFSLDNSLCPTRLNAIESFNWPLTGVDASVSAKAHLDHTYLHVSRPPYQLDIHRNIESTTYVPMPLHYANLFSNLVSEGGDQKQDGAKHVGANVNPLLRDPYHFVHLNPGCLSSMITLHNHADSIPQTPEFRNPFNKVTNSINRLLRIGASDTTQPAHWHALTSDPANDGHIPAPFKGTPRRHLRDPAIVSSLIDFDKKSYFSRLSSSGTSKLLVSAHINVVNVFAIDQNHNYACTNTTQSTSQIYPQPPAPVVPTSHSPNGSSTLVQSLPELYKRVTEGPVLRIQLNSQLMVTSMITIASEMLVVLGLSNGDLFMINLTSLTFRHFNDLGNNGPIGIQGSLSIKSVTSLCALGHPTYGLLIIAGYATGEVVIVDPSAPPKSEGVYVKEVVGSDRFVTYFKLFDLSGWDKKDTSQVDDTSPSYLIGHFKISHKPITSIATTIPYESLVENSHNPMILALASEDGLVRFVDLIATYGKNYGNSDNFYNLPILTDIVSNYFQEGVRDIDFSPDNKFFVSCGKGDLVEIFKMSYYNINVLLRKKTDPTLNKGGRSRSGTINSSSSNLHLLASFLGFATGSNSLEIPTAECPETYYAPSIKDIAIVSRLKGHANTVQKVCFVSKDQYLSPQNSLNTGTYNLISCGSDGAVNFWEFNNKALPRIKKSHFTTSARRHSHNADSALTSQLHSVSSRGKPNPSPNAVRQHNRGRSLNQSEDLQLHTSFSKLGINNLLSSNASPINSPGNSEEKLQIVFSLYKSLYEMRLKKHYTKQKRELKAKYPCILHGIVNDKDLPSIKVPLLTMDLSCLMKNGHISGFHCDSKDFWIYGKSGDIFKYRLGL